MLFTQGRKDANKTVSNAAASLSGFASLRENSFETIVDVLRQRAALTPDKRVFLFLDKGEHEGATLTFAQLDQKAKALGSRLTALGARGKQVLLPNPPGLEFVANFFACLYAGAVAVPACSSLLSARKRDRRLRAVYWLFHHVLDSMQCQRKSSWDRAIPLRQIQWRRKAFPQQCWLAQYLLTAI